MKNSKEFRQIYDKKTAFIKISKWCAYQERSQHEVRNKLFELGLYSNDVEEIISDLISENFINEERFAFAYTSGKFKIKKWGRIKIKQGLKLKKVSDRIIQKAIYSIDDEEYEATLKNILIKKEKIETEKNPLKRQIKLTRYLQSKGFENDLIFLLLKNKDL